MPDPGPRTALGVWLQGLWGGGWVLPPHKAHPNFQLLNLGRGSVCCMLENTVYWPCQSPTTLEPRGLRAARLSQPQLRVQVRPVVGRLHLPAPWICFHAPHDVGEKEIASTLL